mgnify:CR=1 FL=1|jgi:hypothetical protein
MSGAVKTAIGMSVAFALLVGVWWWVSSTGHEAIVSLAREKGLCRDAACISGTMHVYEVIGEKYGLSPGMLDWCVGTDDIAATRVYRGGGIKTIMVEIMRTPCGRLAYE